MRVKVLIEQLQTMSHQEDPVLVIPPGESEVYHTVGHVSVDPLEGTFLSLTAVRPFESLTDEELRAKEAEYRAMGDGCMKHAEELIRFRDERFPEGKPKTA